MKVVLQRSLESNVKVDNEIVGSIEKGLVVLVSFTNTDNDKIIKSMVKKIVDLRIFDDENKIMNKSILDTNGEVLSISQFTLYANTDKGSRPSYAKALKYDEAIKLYDEFNNELKKFVNVKTGVFGADMKVSITNDGPVTIIIEK